MNEVDADLDLSGEIPSLKGKEIPEGEWGDLILIRPNGDYIQYNCLPTLKNLQTLVGGYIEVIPGFTKFGRIPCVVLADEEGKLKNKPTNNRATLEWARNMNGSGDYLVGDILVVSGNAKKEFERDD